MASDWRGRGAAHQPCGPQSHEQQPPGARGKVKRVLKLLFGAADVSVFEVAGEHWVSPDELSGKAEEELRRAVKGKAKVGEAAPVAAAGPTSLSHDSAWSIDQQQAQHPQQRQALYQQPPAAGGQGVEERLRRTAATLLGAGCPSVAQTIDRVYCGSAPAQGSPHQRSAVPPRTDRGVELAAVVTHGGPTAGPGPSRSSSGGSGSGPWDAGMGLSSSGAWGYTPGVGATAAAAGPSSSRAACSSSSGGG